MGFNNVGFGRRTNKQLNRKKRLKLTQHIWTSNIREKIFHVTVERNFSIELKMCGYKYENN